MIDKIPKDEWWINKGNPEKKKVRSQQSENSDNQTSDSEDSDESITAVDAMVLHSGDHMLG